MRKQKAFDGGREGSRSCLEDRRRGDNALDSAKGKMILKGIRERQSSKTDHSPIPEKSHTTPNEKRTKQFVNVSSFSA